MKYSYLTLVKEKNVGIILMNRPPANALNQDLVHELDTMLDQVAADQEIKVVVLTSALKVFMAGADIKMMLDISEAEFEKTINATQKLTLKIEEIPKLVIAAINGHALGGGCELVLACDFRFMARGKARIGLPEVSLGLLPGGGGTQRLARLLGKTKALELIVTGESLSADEALAIGLVNKVFEPDELKLGTLEFANMLAEKATVATGMIKKCIGKSVDLGINEGLAFEGHALLDLLFKTEDAREGLKAFIEKRKPAFKGK
jgi:enoyl-CoA hydratase